VARIQLHESIAVQGIGHITQVAQDAITLREQRGVERVWLIFNGLPIPVKADSTVESVCNDYNQARKDHHYGEHCPYRR